MAISNQQNGPTGDIGSPPKPADSPANRSAAFVDPVFGPLSAADSTAGTPDGDAVRNDIDFIRQNGLVAFIDKKIGESAVTGGPTQG